MAQGRRHSRWLAPSTRTDHPRRWRHATTIVFNPATLGPLIDNEDRVSRITFQDMTLRGGGANAQFMKSVSNGGPQGFIFERIVWDGVWDLVFDLSGTDNNSEWIFYGCRIRGTYNTAFLRNTNVQALHFNFLATDVEPDQCGADNAHAPMFDMQAGGNINVWGGSWIGGLNNQDNAAKGGIFFKLGASTAAPTVNRFLAIGPRAELRNGGWMWMDSKWSGGSITHVSYVDTGYAGDAANQSSYTRMRFSTADGVGTHARWPNIRFIGGSLAGKHEYVVLGQNDAYQQSIIYDNATIQHWSTRDGFIVQTFDPSVSTRLGAAPVIQFINRCTAGSNPTSTVYMDGTLNWHRAKNAPVRRLRCRCTAASGSCPTAATPPRIRP
jgi:hypothetical protein